MICQNCRKEILEGSTQCNYCGAFIGNQNNQYNQYNQYNGYNQYGQQNNNYNTPYNTNNSTQNRKRKKIWVVILIIVIALLLCCGGGIFGFIKLINYTPKPEILTPPELIKSKVLDEDDIDISMDNTSIRDNDGLVEIELKMLNTRDEDVTITIYNAKINNKEVNNSKELETYTLYSQRYEVSETPVTYKLSLAKDSSIDTVELISFNIKINDIDNTYEETTSEFKLHSVDSLENAWYDEATIEDRIELNNNDNTDKENDEDKTKYGNDIVGYIELDGLWVNFNDIGVDHSVVPDMVQYSNMEYIITLNKVENGDAIKTIEGIKYNFTSDMTVKDYEISVDDTENKAEIFVEFKDGSFIMIITHTKSNAMYYYAIETYSGYKVSKEDFKEFALDTFDKYNY